MRWNRANYILHYSGSNAAAAAAAAAYWPHGRNLGVSLLFIFITQTLGISRGAAVLIWGSVPSLLTQGIATTTTTALKVKSAEAFKQETAESSPLQLGFLRTCVSVIISRLFTLLHVSLLFD